MLAKSSGVYPEFPLRWGTKSRQREQTSTWYLAGRSGQRFQHVHARSFAGIELDAEAWTPSESGIRSADT